MRKLQDPQPSQSDIMQELWDKTLEIGNGLQNFDKLLPEGRPLQKHAQNLT